MKRVKFDLSWKLWSLIIGFFVLIGFLGFSYAYGSSNPSIMGHDGNEIDGLKEIINQEIASQGVTITYSDCYWRSTTGGRNVYTLDAPWIVVGFNFNSPDFLDSVYICKMNFN